MAKLKTGKLLQCNTCKIFYYVKPYRINESKYCSRNCASSTLFQKGFTPQNKGKKYSAEIRKKMSDNYNYHTNSGCFKKGMVSINKGKKASLKTLEKMSKSHKGKIVSIETRKKLSKSHLGNTNGFQKGKKMTDDEKLFRREYRCKQIKEIQKKYGYETVVQMGKDETHILNILEECIYPYKIKRQYNVIGYWVDGYCSELNLAIEVDEKYHFKNKEKDLKRQNEIEQELNCNFLRIPVGDIYGC